MHNTVLVDIKQTLKHALHQLLDSLLLHWERLEQEFEEVGALHELEDKVDGVVGFVDLIKLDDRVIASEPAHDLDLVDESPDILFIQSVFGKGFNGELFSDFVFDLVDVREGSLANGLDVLVLIVDGVQDALVTEDVLPVTKILVGLRKNFIKFIKFLKLEPDVLSFLDQGEVDHIELDGFVDLLVVC